MVYSSSSRGDQNILIEFNHQDELKKQFKDFSSGKAFELYFQHIWYIDRKNEPKLYNCRKYVKYYKSILIDYSKIVKELEDFDNLYFYSDTEKPISVLVNLFSKNKKNTSNIILVDEGVASYSKGNNIIRTVLKSICVKILGLHYVSGNAVYGHSKLYNASMATFPDKCVFKGYVKKLPPLNPLFVTNVINKWNLNSDFSVPYVLYVSNVLNECYGISQSDEISILSEIKAMLSEIGVLFYIKPHPTQNEEYYSAISDSKKCVLPVDIPVELLFSKNCQVISVGSSSMINAYVMGLQVYSISGLFSIKSSVIPIPSIKTITTIDELKLSLKSYVTKNRKTY